MRASLTAIVLLTASLLPVAAQQVGSPTLAPPAPGAATASAPSLESNPTTLAPVAPGAEQMHAVPTPKVGDRTTATGGNTNGGAN